MLSVSTVHFRLFFHSSTTNILSQPQWTTLARTDYQTSSQGKPLSCMFCSTLQYLEISCQTCLCTTLSTKKLIYGRLTLQVSCLWWPPLCTTVRQQLMSSRQPCHHVFATASILKYWYCKSKRKSWRHLNISWDLLLTFIVGLLIGPYEC